MFQSLVLMTNNQSLLQLIFKGKTNESLLKVTFPEEFSLSANEKNYSNEKESLKFLGQFILSYIQQEQKILGSENQKALIIYDVFCVQTTDEVLTLLDDSNTLVIKVPPNMTLLFKLLGPFANKIAKIFMKEKFSNWFKRQNQHRIRKWTGVG